MTGSQFLAALEGRPSLSSVPVIVMSRSPSMPVTGTIVALPPKPFDAKAMTGLVERFLRAGHC